MFKLIAKAKKTSEDERFPGQITSQSMDHRWVDFPGTFWFYRVKNVEEKFDFFF